MTLLINPKTDWTETDFYNAEDLNRVETNTQIIADHIKSFAYKIPTVDTKTDRDMRDIEFLSSINRVEENIEEIRKNFITPLNYEGKKEWTLGRTFDYRDANRLENNLKKLYELALIVKDNLIYAGTFSSGVEWEGGLYG